MARLTKREILEGIRGKLNSMSFQHTGDRETDILQAGNAVLRETGIQPEAGMLGPVVETLTAPRPEVISGNRVTRFVEVETTVHQENGEILVTIGRQTYTATQHRTKTERAFRAPHWAGSDADLALFCHNIEWHRSFNPPILPVTSNTYRYHVTGSFDYRESRSLAVLAKSAKCRLANDVAASEQAATLKSQRDEMRRENPPQAPVAPFVKPGSVGTVRRPASLLKPVSSKWFQVNPPMGGTR